MDQSNQRPLHVLTALGMLAVLSLVVLGMPQSAFAEAKEEPAGSSQQKFLKNVQ